MSAVHAVSSVPEAPPLLRRLAALAVLLGAVALLRRAPRGRAPTGGGGRPLVGLPVPTPVLLVGATPGVLRV